MIIIIIIIIITIVVVVVIVAFYVNATYIVFFLQEQNSELESAVRNLSCIQRHSNPQAHGGGGGGGTFILYLYIAICWCDVVKIGLVIDGCRNEICYQYSPEQGS